MPQYLALLILLARVVKAECLRRIEADVVIAGGSLSGLASAVTLANVSLHGEIRDRPLKIALLEPTDWLGGQLTSSAVPPDFGQYNTVPENLPQSFVELLLKVGSINEQWDTNPGSCWVTTKCFQMNLAAEYISKWMKDEFPNVEVHYNTVVKKVSVGVGPSRRDGEVDKLKVESITAIQREPKGRNTGYENNFSKSIHDWYSVEESDDFNKEVIEFVGFKVAIEATELGDVLMNAAAAATAGLWTSSSEDVVVQGYEVPFEDSEQWQSHCGQSAVFPFTIGMSSSEADNSDVPDGNDGGVPFSMMGKDFTTIWSYRRVLDTPTAASVMPSLSSTSKGDVRDYSIPAGQQSNQNWGMGNDYPSGYIFKSTAESLQEIFSTTGWQGGLNLATLEGMEERSFGWFHFYLDQAIDTVKPYLAMNATQVGTKTGLSKMPYLRESRRSRAGVGNHFRLLYGTDFNTSGSDDNRTSRRFADTVGIGDYHFADIHGLDISHGACGQDVSAYPEYLLQDFPLKPYYIPYRAITNERLSNLLTPGKAMAQSFLANAATRLHPTEWSSGAAAGAAAYLMAINDDIESTAHILQHMGHLQALLQSDTVGSPLRWDLS